MNPKAVVAGHKVPGKTTILASLAKRGDTFREFNRPNAATTTARDRSRSRLLFRYEVRDITIAWIDRDAFEWQSRVGSWGQT
jgi:hypothetical protein